jgi:hypothetical protein
MKFYLDLNEEEMRMLRLVVRWNTFDNLQGVVGKLNRFYEIAQTAEK